MGQELEPRSEALRSLFDEYFRDDPVRLADLMQEALKAEVARVLFDLRLELNLSRDQLAQRVAVDSGLIEDLEEADYDGDSFAALTKICTALGRKIESNRSAAGAAMTPPQIPNLAESA
jgi:hypothetical protein